MCGGGAAAPVKQRHKGLFLSRQPHCHGQDTGMGDVSHIMSHPTVQFGFRKQLEEEQSSSSTENRVFVFRDSAQLLLPSGHSVGSQPLSDGGEGITRRRYNGADCNAGVWAHPCYLSEEPQELVKVKNNLSGGFLCFFLV